MSVSRLGKYALECTAYLFAVMSWGWWGLAFVVLFGLWQWIDGFDRGNKL